MIDMEVEVKILEIEKEKVVEKIKELGGKKVKEGEIITYFFDYENNSLKKENAVVRVRSYDGEKFLDYKKVVKADKYKEAKEIRVKVDDVEKAKEFLLSIGMRITKKMKKYRTSFKIGNTLVEIDEIEGIPDFLEVEGEKEEIEVIIEKLGLKDKKRVSFNTEELLAYYGKK